MSLPSAPPAFDASDGAGIGRRADIATAVGLFLLEGAVLFVVFGVWLLSGVSFFPAGGTAVEPDPLDGYLVAAGAVGLFAVLAAAVAFRGRAAAIAWGQGLMAARIAAAVRGGPAYPDRTRERERPAPTSTWQGRVGCRSGGDSDD
ncbi:DUF6234 family protein [Streptomyces flavofungini]|uniref:DUF6234 family protein n=1 Tax=Streptomyces flavofungini TaxID=68200 RepID=UPI0025AEED9D|nr:DUF6234 family protein [Streptomyces flavofungini]WJV50205.1 DUF6234 family protein [Streptomyces flavofungini]